MFSFLKKSTPENTVLQELTEEQLLQVAGGSDYSKNYTSDNDHDADDMKKTKKHHHHKHHHHTTTTYQDKDNDSKTWTSSQTGYSSGNHW
jgi:hypothetical protein